jgi:hypothetical protein
MKAIDGESSFSRDSIASRILKSKRKYSNKNMKIKSKVLT